MWTTMVVFCSDVIHGVGDYSAVVDDDGGWAVGTSSLLVKSLPSIETLTATNSITLRSLWSSSRRILYTSGPQAAFLAVWGEGLARAVYHHHDGCPADVGDDDRLSLFWPVLLLAGWHIWMLGSAHIFGICGCVFEYLCVFEVCLCCPFLWLVEWHTWMLGPASRPPHWSTRLRASHPPLQGDKV